MKQLESYEGLHCANCGAVMQGEFCHACGQSIHSVLKPVHGMIEETVETVFHIDGRIVHTLPPLLLKPGFLTLEYFAGRRIRYIAPFRLMFVLSLLSFFVFHLAIDQLDSKSIFTSDYVDLSDIGEAAHPAAVRATLRQELDDLQTARAAGILGEASIQQTESDARALRRKASDRLVELGAAPMSAASIAAPLPLRPATDTVPLRGKPMNAPLRAEWQRSHVAWLPKLANDRLDILSNRLRDNVLAVRDGDAKTRDEAIQRMVSGVFTTLPPAMFVLIPVFALLLKLFYLFRRRLYMEHLIVALHSHAYIFLSLLLITLAGITSTWLRPHAAWASQAFGWIEGLLALWIPIYLLLMQKRVYRQNWPMTLVKFSAVGWCYFCLLTLVLAAAAVLGMAH